MAETRLSPLKRRVFGLLALLVPVIVLVLVEAGLWLSGYGGEEPLFVTLPEYEDYAVPNPDVGRRYFTRTSVVPAPPHDVFLKQKPDGALRLIVQGGSTGAGFPYGHGAMFSRMLRQRLIQTFPGRHVEVVNTSMAAVNSHTLLDLSGEILTAAPDAVLIYAGHNEYYGAFGVGSVESPATSRLSVRILFALDRFRTVRALRSVLTFLRAPSSSESDRAEGATLMEEMAGDRVIPKSDLLFRYGVEQFRDNMTRMVCRYTDAEVPVFVATLVSNERDQAPLYSGLQPTTDSTQWNSGMENVLRTLAVGDSVGAVLGLERLVEIDSTSAILWYRKGQILDGLGRYSEARAAYRKAKELDQIRFRAPEEMNTVIREVAEACNASLVDVQDAFAAASGGGIIGSELLVEHVHPNLDGYFLISDAFYDALRRSSFGGDWTNVVPAERARLDILHTELDSTLGSWHVRRLLNNWPFQKRGYTQSDTLRIQTAVDSLALDVLSGKRTWVDATAALGAYYERRGDFMRALRAALALADERPYLSTPYLLAANLFVQEGRFSTAIQYYSAANSREPSLEARRNAGGLLARASRFEQAVPWLEGALSLDPDDRSALYDLAVAYMSLGRHDEAVSLANRLHELEPDHLPTRQIIEMLKDSDD